MEIAHVLFIDVVCYTKLLIDQQTHILQQLQDTVLKTVEFRRAQATKQLISLPTGDGMALVFFGDPVAPVRCAIEISRALQSSSQIKLRMGVHSGLVYRMADINANMNVTGGGINMAQRVMDCGDAGHILLSKRVADDLSQLSNWPEALHDLGEVEVKHGVKMYVFNFYTDEVGNSDMPMKFRSDTSNDALPLTPAHMRPGISERPPQAASELSKLRVALLYQRNVQADEHVAKLLEAELQAHGCKIFVDRSLTFGVEWAKEIEHQIHTADAIITLLSAASVTSEMLAYELQMAHDAAQDKNGRPILLPIRINYKSQLPSSLAGILYSLPHIQWAHAKDDQPLMRQLLSLLQAPLTSMPIIPKQKLESVGGAVALDSRFYIDRQTDEEFFAAIMRHDSIVLVKGARQIGKTSLLARGLEKARQARAKVVLTDFQTLSAADLKSVDTLFLALGELIADQLNLNVLPDQIWDQRRSPNRNFQRYLKGEVLDKISDPLVWGIDEIDRLFTCDYGSQVFGLFRSWHNARALDPMGPWRGLTLAIAYATEAHLFITNLDQSPFNVGTRLRLEDFTFEQVEELNRRYGSPLQETEEVKRFFQLLNGHPYLVSKGLHEMVTHDTNLAAFEAVADRDEGPLGDHLRRILVLLAQDTALGDATREVLRGRPCPTPGSFYRLRSAGIIAGHSTGDAGLRCQLYANYLERNLL